MLVERVLQACGRRTVLLALLALSMLGHAYQKRGPGAPQLMVPPGATVGDDERATSKSSALTGYTAARAVALTPPPSGYAIRRFPEASRFFSD